MRQYRYLPDDRRAALRCRVQIFAAEKTWLTGGQLNDITPEMKVTVSGVACLLVLGFEDYCFEGLQTIILHPGAYAHPADDHLVVDHGSVTFGEAWYRGPIVLSWRHALAGARDRDAAGNSILHEFAHHLDFQDRDVTGSPPLNSRDQVHHWQRTTEAEYLRLVGCAQRGEQTLLDPYGATNRAEFFAVATECFFQQPAAMLSEHPQLYAVLRDFYQQHPAQWLQDMSPTRRYRGHQSTESHAASPMPDVNSLTGDDAFSWGVGQLNQKEYQHAITAFARAIECNVHDGEAYQHRALAYLKLQHYQEALVDSGMALDADPDDVDASRVRGGALLGLLDFEGAIRELDHVLSQSSKDAEAFYLRGLARARLGKLRPALRDFSHALAISPHDAEVLYWRGRVYQMLGQDGNAQHDLNQAYQLDPYIDERDS